MKTQTLLLLDTTYGITPLQKRVLSLTTNERLNKVSRIKVNAVSPAVANTPVYRGVFGGKEEAEKALGGISAPSEGRNGSAFDVANSI